MQDLQDKKIMVKDMDMSAMKSVIFTHTGILLFGRIVYCLQVILLVVITFNNSQRMLKVEGIIKLMKSSSTKTTILVIETLYSNQ